MIYFKSDLDLIQGLSKSYSLISSIVQKINIYSNIDDEAEIEITIKLTNSLEEKILLLRFIDVIEYSFYYNNEYNYYNIEIIKFFQIGETFYLSLDPENENEIISNADQDFILCKSVKGFWPNN
jgi:hypothetical protein